MAKNDVQIKPSIPTGIAVGTLIGATFSLIGILVVAILISNERLNMNHLGYAVMTVMLVSVIAGSFSAAMITKSNLLLVSLSTGATLLLTLLAVTAVFFDGQFSGVPATLALVVGGSLASALIVTKLLNKPKSYHKKR